MAAGGQATTPGGAQTMVRQHRTEQETLQMTPAGLSSMLADTAPSARLTLPEVLLALPETMPILLDRLQVRLAPHNNSKKITMRASQGWVRVEHML